MIKLFVFDTNSLISAHLLPQSTTRAAYDKAQKDGLLVYSIEILKEFAEVFSRDKFNRYLNLEDRMDFINAFEQRSLYINVSSELKASRDPDDDMFLQLAVDSKATCIISGDPHLLELHPFHGIPILNAADFLKSF
jgi:putative PIN family toxin of toxin-antitoxin system